MEEAILQLESDHPDNYTEILPIEKYMGSPHYKAVYPMLDTAIKKVSVVASVHRIGKWTDDCYLLAGKAQYLKHDFKAATETLKYLIKEFNPGNPDSQYWKYKENPKEKRKGKKVSYAVLKNKYAAEVRGDGGLGNNPAYNRGKLWLARTYVEQDIIGRAQALINEVKANYYPSEEMKNLLLTTQAKLYLHEEKYERAADELSSAIEFAPDREHKARYAFIAAQLYELSDKNRKAGIYYDKARNYATSYEMIFNAELNQMKSAYANGKRSRSSILDRLDKMTKDEKNDEYLDFIYFTMAQIYEKDKDYDAAVTSYRKALAHKTRTSTITLESYHSLAMLYYGRDEFIYADSYLDSCIMLMSPDDKEYASFKELSEKLDPIAKNLRIIAEQDSLIAISEMSQEEQRKLAAAIKAEQEAKATEMKGQQGMNAKSPFQSLDLGAKQRGKQNKKNTVRGVRRGKYTGNFFAYQKDTKKERARNFEKEWGDFPLVDNWRVSALRDESKAAQDIEEKENQQTETQEVLTEAEVQKYLKDVPRNKLELLEAKKKISDAMAALGFLYRSKLKRPDLSIEILEELLSRFPGIKKSIDVYYNLYLAYKSVNRLEKAEKYKQYIIDHYSNSTIAKILKDPSFKASQEAKLQKLSLFYKRTYEDFRSGNYKKVHARVNSAYTDYGKDNEYAVKFALLDAMATGKTKGEIPYANALKDLIKDYKGTPEAIHAEEILRFLHGSSTAFKDGKSSGEFVVEDDKLHYIMISIKNPNKINRRKAKISVSEFNSKYFGLEDLKVSTIYLDIKDNSAPIIIVRRFENRERAMNYYETAKQFAKDFLPTGTEYAMYAVNQQNYRQILRTKTLVNYREFFEQHYLKGN